MYLGALNFKKTLQAFYGSIKIKLKFDERLSTKSVLNSFRDLGFGLFSIETRFKENLQPVIQFKGFFIVNHLLSYQKTYNVQTNTVIVAMIYKLNKQQNIVS